MCSFLNASYQLCIILQQNPKFHVGKQEIILYQLPHIKKKKEIETSERVYMKSERHDPRSVYAKRNIR